MNPWWALGTGDSPCGGPEGPLTGAPARHHSPRPGRPGRRPPRGRHRPPPPGCRRREGDRATEQAAPSYVGSLSRHVARGNDDCAFFHAATPMRSTISAIDVARTDSQAHTTGDEAMDASTCNRIIVSASVMTGTRS
ncbi:hypothetical protein CP978_20940 [Streptomyces nodosus]|uniref:Uncharacterized protein n=1 Tax=Streptomyces nodosus TaxID=40318 RepID=A0A5P2WBG1_9ACTN|nr:hypothetical protein CP978_20940 [Streptomyces nodosus]